jgi:Holliday junction resolvasome RuvABC endonuclease subunit
MGVAWTFDERTVFVSSVVGSQFEHLDFLKRIVGRKRAIKLVVEQLNIFRNAKTVRTLLLKTGFIAFSISRDVEFVPTSTPRKWLGCKGKQEVFDLLKPYGIKNNDESDALALLLYAINKKESEVTIERV